MWDHRKSRKRIPLNDSSYQMATDDLWHTITEMWHGHVTKIRDRHASVLLTISRLEIGSTICFGLVNSQSPIVYVKMV